MKRLSIDKPVGGVGGPAVPPTPERKSLACTAIFVRFCQKSLPYTNERPAVRPGSECGTSTKWQRRFADSLCVKRLLMLLLCLGLMSGCSLLPEEERAFAVCLGIDRAGETWSVSVRLPTYTNAGEYLTVTAQGKTMGEAMTLLDASAPIHVHYGQVRLVIFSRGLAQSDAFPMVLSDLSDISGFRMAAYAAVTEDPMAEVMEALTPETGTRLSKFLEVMLSSRVGLGTVPDARMGDILRGGARQSPLLADVALAAGDAAVPGLDAPAGQTAAGGLSLQIAGAWLMGLDGRVQGRLTAAEHQLLRLMQGKIKKGAISLGDSSVTVLDSSAQIHWTGGQASCAIRLHAKDAHLTDQELEAALTSDGQAVLAKLAAADCDALGLGRRQMMRCADWAAWQNQDWVHRYPTIPWQVTVTLIDEV